MSLYFKHFEQFFQLNFSKFFLLFSRLCTIFPVGYTIYKNFLNFKVF